MQAIVLMLGGLFAGCAAAAGAVPQASAPVPGPTLLDAPFRAMQLPSGQRVAALNGSGAMRTLSVGCRGGVATMLLATRAPMPPTEVVIRTPTRTFAAIPAATRPGLWAFRLPDRALFDVLTSAEAGFNVTIGGRSAGSYSLAGAAAVRAALSPCTATTTAVPAPMPAVAPVGVMGIPLRRGHYVPAQDRCDRATSVFRLDASGHAEGYATDRRLTAIRWKRATRRRDGSFDVEYMAAPGEVAGDEIVINIRPAGTDAFVLTIQDDVRMRRCEPDQVPGWARR